ncbi:beta-Ala-Xaa dipeptidase [Oxobacter pfennigii]|uniref:Beta-Ala-Xaa dipeptidase n=1 Tax=Oxobacter pfennigii TaxID=36849 RepID=A0A0P8WK16_9CLOT|nr:dipeptidase PepV [Oxobacter pfennigii]KPU42549.1 beta-Ala-Xaa dipeptidase [Oxobacter pfennigii]
MNLESIIDGYKDEIVKSTRELIKIRSVRGNPEPGMPYGQGPYEALTYVLDLSRNMGFKVKNVDGHAGHAEFGEGSGIAGILVHVDTVPEGGGWTFPPFEGIVHDGKLYGRGALDDKGPAIAALYGIKALMECGVKPCKKIRIVFGTDEETGCSGIQYYLSNEKAFDIGFTPDANFPVINGEKGILALKLYKKFDNTRDSGIRLKHMKGGSAPNVVPDCCTAIFEVQEDKKAYVRGSVYKFNEKYGYDLKIETMDDDMVLYSKGKTAHASTPEKGLNAISVMMLFIYGLGMQEDSIYDFIRVYKEKIGMEYNGRSIGCGFYDELSGKLTLNAGMIDLNSHGVTLTLDIRYPVTYKSSTVCEGIYNGLNGTGIDVEVTDDDNPIYIPEDHFLIQKLMKVYKGQTAGDKSRPIVIGGGTYARSMKNTAAFGPVFPGEEELAHQKDEYITVENLIKLTKIYSKAIYELSK